MSYVTDTFLLTSASFDPEDDDKNKETISAIQAWLRDDCNQQLKRIDDTTSIYGGSKVMQASVWAGAFNYMTLSNFIPFLKSLDWRDSYGEDCAVVQLLVQDEHDMGFTLVDIHGEKEVAGWE